MDNANTITLLPIKTDNDNHDNYTYDVDTTIAMIHNA